MPHLLRQQVLLWHTVDCCGEVGRKLCELSIALARRAFGICPVGPQINPLRFAGKFMEKLWRQGKILAHKKVARRVVPDKLTVGQADQQRLDRVVLDPVTDLLVDPFGGSGFR